MSLLVDFVEANLHKEATLGIIVFYRGQLRALELALSATVASERLPADHSRWPRVMTVAKWQGRESDYMILSPSRANYTDFYFSQEKSLGFVSFFEMANVALTRARLGIRSYCCKRRFM